MHLLKELGISSPQEAAELEHDLGISFSDLTHDQRETWKQQTVYLGLYAETGTYTRSARAVGITVRTVRTWQTENTLGFNDRLELAVLEYSEGIDLMLLQHVRKPDCSPSLLMMFARAQFPEKYGPVRRDNALRNTTNRCDHQCDHDPLPPTTSRYDLQLLEEISRDLQNLKQFARLSEPSNLSPTVRDTITPHLSPAGGETQRGGIPAATDHAPVGPGLKPAHDPSAVSPPTPSPVVGEGWGEGPAPTTQNPDPNLSPTARDTVAPILSPTVRDTITPNLSPVGGEIQRGGTPTPTDHAPVGAGFKPAHDSSTPSVASPLTPSPVLGEGPAPTTQNHDPDRSPTDQTPVEPGFRPAPDLSSNGSHPGSAPQHQAPTTQNPEPALNRRQRREFQRRAKRQKSHLARAPN